MVETSNFQKLCSVFHFHKSAQAKIWRTMPYAAIIGFTFTLHFLTITAIGQEGKSKLFLLGNSIGGGALFDQTAGSDDVSNGWSGVWNVTTGSYLDMKGGTPGASEVFLQCIIQSEGSLSEIVLPGAETASGDLIRLAKSVNGIKLIAVDSPKHHDFLQSDKKVEIVISQRKAIEEFYEKGSDLQVVLRKTDNHQEQLPEIHRMQIVEVSRFRLRMHLPSGPLVPELVDHAVSLPSIEYLDLGSTKLTGSQLNRLNGRQKLKTLWLDNVSSEIPEISIELPSLERINVSRTKVAFPREGKLKDLVVTETEFPLRSMSSFRGIANIERVDLSLSKLADKDIEILNSLTSLKHVTLRDCVWNESGPDKLQLPNCEFLDLSGNQLYRMPVCPKLKELALNYVKGLNSETIDLNQFPNLAKIHLLGVKLPKDLTAAIRARPTITLIFE